MINHHSYLIKNADAVLTGLSGDAARSSATDIRIQDGKITELGQLTAHANEQIVDAKDCIIYPAWVNTHHHLFQSLLKGEPQGLNQSLTAWLASTPYRFRGAFDEQTFRIAVRIGLIELLRSGCATVADHHYLYWPQMPFDGSAILFDEAEKLGMRFVLCRGGATLTRGLESELPQALRPEKFEDYMADIERLVGKYHQADSAALRKIVMAPTSSLHSTTPQQFRETAKIARQLGIGMHSHLSETVDYLDAAKAKFNMTPVQFCAEHDWVGSDVWFAHLVKLLPEEIHILGQTQTGIAHCPQSNARLGSGIADLVTLEQAGMTISIGVDGAASNEAADMLSETHVAWLLQRARKGMLAKPQYEGGLFEGGGDAATIEDIIRWGTAGGAKSLGLDQVGTLEVGQQADLVIYQLDDPRYFGLHDVAIAPIASAGRAKIKVMFIAGKMVMENDQIPDLDMQELAWQAKQSVKVLQQRSMQMSKIA
ncbi:MULTISPECIES: amidohydrolase family protein [unclassified Acinetobacter]|uniref:amidohydrolase family protein n=1 Tax=unclassified Acinetobacter TaxID=196816 RepID=UPI00244BC356|nr:MULTISPECIES: amidohydrolase family protein [unclassified Acinetobacter]MDH0030109.1 amidohydrolase family protein [Acinetobacter sp. GD04021]MDH0885059.1 amidohydrolase family protein [Acinetobacter sp. GD03873]MDH1082297.1 amidohydrolase family protein [Acinetobacter sp. GD03983]MDH2188500.1 amidohydrolase family protein [Acinetobacter sp. GD03645]MDH2201977.1 amidohydrolase family protein [Acinetobacter sp. GD03647]